jgi:hypothetical protein
LVTPAVILIKTCADAPIASVPASVKVTVCPEVVIVGAVVNTAGPLVITGGVADDVNHPEPAPTEATIVPAAPTVNPVGKVTVILSAGVED